MKVGKQLEMLMAVGVVQDRGLVFHVVRPYKQMPHVENSPKKNFKKI